MPSDDFNIDLKEKNIEIVSNAFADIYVFL